MTETITLSSKGQFTLPVQIREAMDLQTGDKLDLTFHPTSRTVTIKKPLTVEELSAKFAKYVEPGTRPILDVDAFYQKHREPRQ